MAVDLLGHAFGCGEQRAFREAAAAGLRSLELLASSLSSSPSSKPPAVGEIADQAVHRFRRVINLLDRTGHARFRRAPPAVVDSPPASPRSVPAPAPTVVSSLPHKSQTLLMDFTKLKAAPAASATSTSFLSSVTAGGGGGEGSVTKGQTVVSSGKPPLPHKRKQHPCSAAAPSPNTTTASGQCHCSRKRQRKHHAGATTRTVRVPVPAPGASPATKPSSADIPSDDYSWRKYGQKPIKGSPFPRGYYRCSTVKGCPARKHVERDAADPATLLVTYEGDHRHDAPLAGGGARVAA